MTIESTTEEITPLAEPVSDNSSPSYGSVEPAERYPPDESVEVVRTPSETIQILPTNGDSSVLENDGGAAAGAPLTRRLRCLFSTVTWPIVPLGSFVSLALIWVLYTAFVLDLRRSCSHPLHWYAFASFVLVLYAPNHHRTRLWLFGYSRERDGPIRPRLVRMYDQLFHTICLIYVYGGVTLLQTCRDDEFKGTNNGDSLNGDSSAVEQAYNNTCEATCPNLYQALCVYVTTLEMFTFALILPLLFLPCIYLWILRRATEEIDAFAQLQERLEEEEALLAGEGVTAQELMDSLEGVRLVSRTNGSDDGKKGDTVVLLEAAEGVDTVSETRDGSDVKECCICMTEFEVQREDDIESGLSNGLPNTCGSRNASPPSPETASLGPVHSEDLMVRTKCGHVFHQQCLAGWIGGRWEPNQQANDVDRIRRRARRTCCPLCREDLKPQNDSQAV